LAQQTERRCGAAICVGDAECSANRKAHRRGAERNRHHREQSRGRETVAPAPPEKPAGPLARGVAWRVALDDDADNSLNGGVPETNITGIPHSHVERGSPADRWARYIKRRFARAIEPFAEAVRDELLEARDEIAKLRADVDHLKREADLQRQLAAIAARLDKIEGA
jgi:hypothetical protein